MNKKTIILSVKPEFASSIMSGTKTVELRRRFPSNCPKKTVIIIYSTSPIKSVIGYAFVKEVVKLPIQSLWQNFGERTSVTHKFFQKYFSGLEEGYGIILEQPTKLSQEIELKELSKEYNFFPPQSYMYASHELKARVYAS